jgi:predicted ferric reductase
VTTTAARASIESPGFRRGGARQHAADRAWLLAVIVVANGVVTVGLWFRHGGPAAASGAGGIATAIGELTALVGTYAVLLQITLMARIPWLERFAGLDRLAVWHRWNGFAAFWLLLAHTVFTTVGYARGTRQSVARQTWDFVTSYADVFIAYVGLVLLVAVVVTSLRAARRRLRRERWYLVHLTAYAAVALAFAHQLAVGTDFEGDRVARTWWVALYVTVALSILIARIGWPVWFNTRHRMRIVSVHREAPAVVSLVIGGRDLDRIRVEPGQFFLWRFLTPGGWRQAHPFSLSAAPSAQSMRITVKQLGDRTAELQRIRPGTRVFAEGPYGTFTAHRRRHERVLLVAGGIGITPLRALLGQMAERPEAVTLLYRVATPDDVVFGTELARAREHGVRIHVLVGSEIGDDTTDQLGLQALQRLVPDVRSRDCFVCGPPAFADTICRRLRVLGVPRDQIHRERFEL